MSDRRVAWIRAQLDEDERVARACPGPVWEHRQVKGAFDEDIVFEDYVAVADARDRTVLSDVDEDVLPYVLRFDPAAVLADVEAKRALLDSHYDYGGVCPRCFDWQNKPVQREPFPCEVVRLLAEGFRGRPGYEEAMRDGEPPKKLRADTGDGRSLPCLKCGTSTPDASYCDSCGMPFCDNCTHECPCR